MSSVRIAVSVVLVVAVANNCFALLGGKDGEALFSYSDRLVKEKMKLVPEDKRKDRKALVRAFYPVYTNGWYDGMYIPTNTFLASGEDILRKVNVISDPDESETFEFCGAKLGRPMSEQKGKHRRSSRSPGGRSDGFFTELPIPLGKVVWAKYETGLDFVLNELQFAIGGKTQEEFERSLDETFAFLEANVIKGRLKGCATEGCFWPVSSLSFDIDRPNCKVTFAIIQVLLEDHTKARSAQLKVVWQKKNQETDAKKSEGH